MGRVVPLLKGDTGLNFKYTIYKCNKYNCRLVVKVGALDPIQRLGSYWDRSSAFPGIRYTNIFLDVKVGLYFSFNSFMCFL